MEPKLPGDIFHKLQITNDLAAVDLDDDPLECRVIRHLPAQVLDGLRVLKKRDRQIDRELDRAVLGNEIAPIVDRLADDELRQAAEVGITVVAMK